MATHDVNYIKKTVVGDMRCHILSVTAGAATHAVDTGLSHVYGFSIGPVSMSTSAAKCFMNKRASGTTAAGFLGLSGLVDGDVMNITVYGK